MPVVGLIYQFCPECLEAGRMQRSTFNYGCYSAEIATAQSIPAQASILTPYKSRVLHTRSSTGLWPVRTSTDEQIHSLADAWSERTCML